MKQNHDLTIWRYYFCKKQTITQNICKNVSENKAKKICSKNMILNDVFGTFLHALSIQNNAISHWHDGGRDYLDVDETKKICFNGYLYNSTSYL